MKNKALSINISLVLILIGVFFTRCTTTQPPITDKMGTIELTILDEKGDPILSNIDVKTPFSDVMTASKGKITFTAPPSDRLPVTFSTDDFMTSTKILISVPGETVRRDIHLLKRAKPQKFNLKKGVSIDFGKNGNVTIPPNSLVSTNEKEIVGDPKIQVTYINPTDSSAINTSPGDFQARLQDGSLSQLQTYGMLEIYITDERNNRLDLSDGNTATINWSQELDTIPRSQSLFEFNTQTGNWEEVTAIAVNLEAQTAIVEIPSTLPTWNDDDPIATTRIRVKVQDIFGNPRSYVLVQTSGVNYIGTSQAYTNNLGVACPTVRLASIVNVTAGPVTITRNTPTFPAFPSGTCQNVNATITY